MNRAALAGGAIVEVSIARRRLFSSLSSGRRNFSSFKTAAMRYFTSTYVAISSGFRSPRMALGGLMAKNRQAEPAKGSTYRLCFWVQNVWRIDNRRRLLPAHRKKGAQSCLGDSGAASGIPIRSIHHSVNRRKLLKAVARRRLEGPALTTVCSVCAPLTHERSTE